LILFLVIVEPLGLDLSFVVDLTFELALVLAVD
jgi:hypothetical protein